MNFSPMTTPLPENIAVRQTAYGYYELAEKPTPEQLSEYYEAKYYQQSVRTHQHHYEADELLYRHNKLEQKRLKVENLLDANVTQRRFLDIGAGEGFALAHFAKSGWEVVGMDYSSFGCGLHHPDFCDRLLVGDLNELMNQLIASNKKYELILMDNVLEHVLQPLEVLQTIRDLLAPTGILIIEVPNDFSALQTRLLESGRIPAPFWVVSPDHISYFNQGGLRRLAMDAGLKLSSVMSDFPIDFALCNENTNYVVDKSKGKSCHRVRVELDNLIHEISPEGANCLYEALGSLGLGRQIIGFFQHAG
jgi:2-polyprenyl-3-methyl-5-hydroxy-6-metoxy-1,4-benzoquinol methylase